MPVLCSKWPFRVGYKSETVLMFEALYCSKDIEFRNILYQNR